MFNTDNINNIDPAAKFESKMLMSISLGDGSFSTGSGGSINSGFSSGASQGSTYDEFGTGVVGDTIANQVAVGGFNAGSMGEGDSFSFGPQRTQAQIQADVNRQLEDLAVKRAQAAQNVTPAFGDPYDRPPMSLEDILISDNLAAFDATRMGFDNSLLSKLPSTFGAIGGAIANYNRDQMRQALMQGGTPLYRPDGRTIGAVKLGGRMYGDSTLDPNYDDSMAGGDNENAFGPRRIYPLTPEEQAEEEYQSSIPTDYIRTEDGFYPETGAYARMGLLDTMPENLLEFMPNFAEQNRAFRMGSATRPEYFQDPYNLQGYSLLS
jgi:hypothetical protein